MPTWFCFHSVFSYFSLVLLIKGKLHLSGCISQTLGPLAFSCFSQQGTLGGDGEHPKRRTRRTRAFLSPSQAGSCILCGFCCAPGLVTCPMLLLMKGNRASLWVAFRYTVYFLTSSMYLTSLVHLIPFVSTNKIIRAENREI